MISRLMCRSWINVTQGREGSLWGWERKLFESHCERESLKAPALFRSPGVWKATAAENLWGKEESCSFRRLGAGQSRYRQPVQVSDNIDTEDNTHRQLNQRTHEKKGPKILNHMFSQILDFFRVLQSITECCRVLQSITEYCRVLQIITEYYRVLQSVTECYRVLQSVTEYYRLYQTVTE